MALNQYFEEGVPQRNSLEDKSSQEMWKCGSAEAISGSSGFDCNICLDCVQDPVVTLCGHLYCWPCIYKWLNFHGENKEKQKNKPQCPVCKSDISQSSIVPLYGRGLTTPPSKDHAHQIGNVTPPRPLAPSWMTNLPRSLEAANVSQHTSQVYHPHYLNHSQQYTSPMLDTSGSLTNALNTTYGVFGEMIYARIFGNQVTNIYTYPNSYNLSGISNPRIRRHLMRADKSLSRICFFLLCCTVLCLLLF
ncbi:E3 ubiquitin-protein ligase RMA1H1 [Cicer arietinum]|uniref:E3 ubiquitin-protein ligase RMA n=1 Tax=Cicer arietinum TaxID=3827 RepID=A0A1S2XCP7_CICAR|nr:E3 ubiquitin-protein ligase RMA1H1 [Cicer arietinum]XP_004487286.1 E3 ubiquitin-protein ligase RMA1H1 [Cicer arietinum]